tara:strand:+ start:510 stop:914 length:405 start_codon:yes stop_codon:yes gene_type:complete
MHLVILFMIFVTSSCATSKYSHNYFLNCEKKFSEFNALTSCALEQIQQDCKKVSDCKFENKRFVEIIKRLKTMVENDEITENEAMFRYLNLIEIEETKFQYTNRKNFNYEYYPNYNDFYVRGMLPFYFRNGYFY